MRRDLPAGTVTFLFTDIEGSTKLLHELGAERYAEALAEHRRILREAFVRHGGVEVDTQGDAFFVAFPTAPGAVRAASEAQGALGPGPVRVRMGLHTGNAHHGVDGYVGLDVHRAARIASAGHGGQVLVSATTAALVGTSELHDLGEHRPKDLSAPERIYQLGEAEFPPLKTLYQTNLPVPATPFLGREQELGDVVRLLGTTRLLTLTGPGGTGKTRLALQAAAGAADAYSDGVWWVPLASLRDHVLVLETAARVLGTKGDIAAHIADRSMLLLCDNFEQVVGAAPGLSDVLASCPNLRVLVTSREPLRVSGEQEYRVPSLAHDESIVFFTARARGVRPDFEGNGAVSDICRRLDDLPLALELAAARVKALSTGQILRRLDKALPLLTGGARDLPDRQRTLRATIAWSHDLLAPEEQRLFARLAVFRGGCVLEAAEEVCGADVDTLQSLVDKSLLRRRDDRFLMLETIREFAVERLHESADAEEVTRKHAQLFLALAEEAGRHDLRWNPGDWFDRLEGEHDNIRAALDHFEASGEGELALRLGASIWRFWQLKDHRDEGRRRLEWAIASDASPTAFRAGGLAGLSTLCGELGDSAAARLWAERALELNRQLGDEGGVALSIYQLAHASYEDRDFARGTELFQEAAGRFAAAGDLNYALKSEAIVAASHYDQGDVDTARMLEEDILRQARALGNRQIETDTLGTLAQFAIDQSRLEDALTLLREALALARRGDDRAEIAHDLRRFAHAYAMGGRAELAAVLLSSSEALREATGFRRRWFLPASDEELARIREHLDEGAFAEAWERGRRLSVEEAVDLALDPGL